MSGCDEGETVKGMQELKAGGIHGEQGVAMLTVLMVMLMMTVLGIAAITVSGLENNIAGLQRTMESAAQAAESGLGTSVNVLLQVLLPENGNQIPAALLSDATPPGPVPVSNKAVFEGEIIGNPESLNDVPIGSGAVPNITMSVGSYAVACDVDRMYVKPRAGSGQQQFAAYDGAGVGAGSNGVDVYFKVDCVGSNTATGTESRAVAVYACALTGDGCQKQP